MTTCSATLTTLLPVISATVMLRWAAAAKSKWSDPTPAVSSNFRLGARPIRSRGDIGGPEGSGDDHVGVGQVAIESRARIGDGHEVMPARLYHLPQAKGVLGATEEFGGVFGVGAAGYSTATTFICFPSMPFGDLGCGSGIRGIQSCLYSIFAVFRCQSGGRLKVTLLIDSPMLQSYLAAGLWP